MATNLRLDERLLAKAVKLGGGKSESETVDEALAEYVRKREVEELIALFGTIDYEPGFDHRKLRRWGNEF